MSRVTSTVLPWAFLCSLLLVSLTACGPSSPEGKIAEARAGYTIELNAWRALEKAPPEAEEASQEAAEGAIAAEGAAVASTAEESAQEGGEEGEEEMVTGPQPRDILFDLIVLFRGRNSLKGVTVDVTHADSAQQEKATYHHYIDLDGIISGETRQVDFVLEGLEFEEGDVFAVDLAQGIPQDLGKYREFSEPAP